jgi:TatD DNase family protein
MEFVDTHAHLYAEEFKGQETEIIRRAKAENITRIILPAIDITSHELMIAMAGRHSEMLFPLMGLHPTSVKSDYKKELAQVENYISQRSLFHGIGEIGIDLYWDKSHLKEQIDAFVTQVKWAIELNWPIVIHTRDSFDEVYNELKPLVTGNLSGIFHCFGGTLEQANKIIDMGFMLGIGGVVTFKNSNLRSVLEHVDLNYIVLETDSPYLAPVPFRGKQNESSYLKLVAEKVSEVYQIPLHSVAEITTTNAKKVFNL